MEDRVNKISHKISAQARSVQVHVYVCTKKKNPNYETIARTKPPGQRKNRRQTLKTKFAAAKLSSRPSRKSHTPPRSTNQSVSHLQAYSDTALRKWLNKDLGLTLIVGSLNWKAKWMVKSARKTQADVDWWYKKLAKTRQSQEDWKSGCRQIEISK